MREGVIIVEGFGLLVGHLAGDYILQSDWMASWKSATAGDMTAAERELIESAGGDVRQSVQGALEARARRRPAIACTCHCLTYTLAVWVCSLWWMPWWGLPVCFLAHWPIDRYRLAASWMRAAGQSHSASRGSPCWPWSIIVVDNTFHLLTLWLILVIAKC